MWLNRAQRHALTTWRKERQRRRMIMLVLILLCLGLCLVAGLTGCALFKYESKGPPPMPLKPVEPYELEEAIREGADYVQRALAMIRDSGAAAHAPVVAHAEEVAAVVSGHLGKPVEPLPLPERAPEDVGEPLAADEPPPKWRKSWRHATVSVLRDWGEVMAAYAALLAKHGRTPVTTGWSISSPMLGSLVGLLMLGIVALVVFRVLFGRLGVAKFALRQVVQGVQSLRSSVIPASSDDEFKRQMNGAQDEATRQAVDKLKVAAAVEKAKRGG